MPAEQYTVMPFSRFLTGPADITSTMLDPVQLETGKFTWPNQMAQLVVFLSPVTHFCDQYKFYVNHPAKDLFEEIPVEWDETRVLKNTKIGEVVVYARRKGNVWWLGAINNSYLREIDLAFDFLSKPGKASLVYDDPKVNAAIKRVEETIQPSDVRKILLRPSGGFFARITE
jgi:alpha-glucosidase